MAPYELDPLMKEKYLKWWNRENEHPMIAVFSRKTLPRFPTLPIPPRDLERRWTDPVFNTRLIRFIVSNIHCAGAAIPVYWPNLGPDILGASTGWCDIKYGKSTTWAEPKVKDWDEVGDLKLDENNPYWKKLLAVTEAGIASGRRNFLMGTTDLHTGTDGLVSLRGPENLCLDLIDCPELVEKYLKQLTDFYIGVYDRLDKILDGEKYGRSTWNMVWSDTKYNIVCSDFSCMIGPRDYERFVAPHIQDEIDYLDRSIYHLDGVNALQHLDRILSFKKLTGVEWVPGDGKPPMREWLHILKKIQDAGKVIEVAVTEEDIKPLCENLDPRGLLLRLFVFTKTKANRIAAYAESVNVKKSLF